ncbi:MAG: nucleoside triphosphate pyrophosphohydrolase [bacterium]
MTMADKRKHDGTALKKTTGGPPPGCADPVARLLRVMAALRGEAGCPWDRAQTHRSLAPFLIEEAYELIEAIEDGGETSGDEISGDETTGGGQPAPQDAAIREELGDVLLQVVFHAQIAEERGVFSFRDVAGGLADKLEARHPHVFGGDALPDPEAVREAWHRTKMKTRDSAMDGVPSALPALQWAHQVSQRAAREGFEWNHRGEIHDKAAEELGEFREAISALDGGGSREAAEMELGDILFSLVQLARWEGIDPEAALRRSTRKFISRFRWMEEALRAQGRRSDLRQPSQQQPGRPEAGQWWALWNEAKTGAKTGGE